MSPTDSPPRFRLSAQGFSTTSDHRATVGATEGANRRKETDDARARWSHSHGLEPADGAYLGELSPRPLTLQQLGEAMAVWSQTQDMVTATIDRLVEKGLVAHDTEVLDPGPPTAAMARDELEDAERQLDSLVRTHQRTRETIHICLVDPPLRSALSRVMAARRFVVTFTLDETETAPGAAIESDAPPSEPIEPPGANQNQ